MRSCDCSSDVCASDLEALTWHHKFDALVDYRRTSGVTEKERLNTSYKGQRRIGKRLYAFGLLQYERDRPAGYYRRFSEGFGLGVRLVDQPDLRLDRSEEHTSELQSLMRISYAVFCLKKK